ncbi:hypothetical protein DYB32_002563 [Aphanomyces invadans]|uniref:Exonuclease 1 n=1 Tax=Aphanomyces invadans TaxID=157072 RepID=A0A3R6Z2G5_9STRA|nr:hypothetical protein DYB32_002563 [Aphanomyces invadans]
MGIDGLLVHLGSVMSETHVSRFDGKRAGIDISVWMYGGASANATELALQAENNVDVMTIEHTLAYESYCISRLELLLKHNITPVVVEKAFARSLKITRAMARKFRRTLQRLHPSIECIVAPYEADAELAHLSLIKYVDVVISEDSDLIPYGCHTVLFKMNDLGQALEFRRRHIGACEAFSFIGWTELQLVLPYQGLACSLDSINFTALSNLEVLNLEGNEFTGPLPEWIGTMSSLEVLNLNGNRLHGPLLDSIIDNVNLVELSLAQNELTGLVPNQLKVLPLEVLDLFGNQFSGPLPPDVLRNPRLRYLDLSENALSGPFPPHMLLPRLAHFDVSFNELTGPLPPNMHLFGRDDTVTPSPSQLEYFDASNNRLESAIPGLIGQLERLAVFSVRNNSNIFGSISDVAGATQCSHCPKHTMAPRLGSSACMLAPPGSVLKTTAWPSFLLTLSQPQQFRLDDLNMSKITEIVHHAWLFVSPEPMSSLVVRTFDNKLANNQQFGGTSSVSLHVVLDTHVTTLELLQHIPAYLVVLDMLLDEAAMLLVTDDAPTRLDVLQPLQLPVAVPCGKGTFSNGTHCVDCGVGTFNDRLGATKCHKCHRGSHATATKCMECPTFSIDLSLVCPQANGRFMWLVFYILYYLHFVWTSHLYLYGQPTRAPPLMASYRANGGQTVNTAIVWPPPIVISAATLRSKRGI